MSDQVIVYPKRLIEVDLPIARISAHARREKSIRHGHISTLHTWWARRPLAACRAVICATLWPDPVDNLCPPQFRENAFRIIDQLRTKVVTGGISPDQRTAFAPVSRMTFPNNNQDLHGLRQTLLDFIAEFANWDLSTNKFFLEASRALTQSAHESLGGEPGTQPLVVDPFAGGGSIPLEALRVGADVFATDLNPVPVLLNKMLLEYIPKYGQRLADEVREWGEWVKREAEKDLADFYPKDPDGATPLAYLWARTILSEAPDKRETPVEVPLLRSLWLATKTGRKRALRWARDSRGKITTEDVVVTYIIDNKPTPLLVTRPLFDLFAPEKDNEVEGGTVARGSVTCPITGFTTRVESVRAQLKKRGGGGNDARLFCVVTTRASEQGRFYRLPSKEDLAACTAARETLSKLQEEQPVSTLSLIPDEEISLNELRRISVPLYGIRHWGNMFSPRQGLALATLARLVREAGEHMRARKPMAPPKRRSARINGGIPACTPESLNSTVDDCSRGLSEAVQTCLAFAVNKLADKLSTHTGWKSTAEYMGGHTFGRQAIGMVWDWCEANPMLQASGSWRAEVDWIVEMVEYAAMSIRHPGHCEQASATAHPLPNDSAAAVVTDPPYYDAVPYAYLSDFFYVWLRRTLMSVHPYILKDASSPKAEEIVVDRPHKLSQSHKDISFYERELARAFSESRRIVHPYGISCIVFASKITASWEAILKAVIDSGWIVTGSWPIDTEMETRLAAMGQARLGSSVHLVCRPRENLDGTLRNDAIGDWGDVLQELPGRIHDWMPRLATEGVVGADAIFACLGPALEIFSRYSKVEKANGDVVPLSDYLEHVWATVSSEALSMIFKDADAAGLEPDARLTAMWLWTLNTGTSPTNGAEGREPDSDEASEEDEEESISAPKSDGFVLEFDAARKIAQGLGIHLEKIPSVVEVKGDKARLLPVAERTKYLFGKEAVDAPTTKKKPKKKDTQLSFFEALQEADAAESVEKPELKAPPPGSTVLDRVHQAMILFAAGRGEALKRFLVEEGIGKEGRFWKLAQSLSALYPPGIDEKRWVDGVLARKKTLGL